MSPLDALRVATLCSAEAYGLEGETGAIKTGLDADLLVFDRNPIEQPSVLHNPLMVMSNDQVGVNRQVGLRKGLLTTESRWSNLFSRPPCLPVATYDFTLYRTVPNG